MHEESLVRALLKQVDDICRQHDGRQVTEVCVEAGPLSGVEPLLLSSAFERLAPPTLAASARLVIDEVALLAECVSCRGRLQVENFVFLCPRCGAGVRVLSGEGLRLVSVSLECNSPRQESA